MTEKIGILGGTFDPVHLGHIQIANYATSHLALDRFYFLPTYCPVHKANEAITDAKHRMNMLELSIADYPKFHIETTEIQAEGKLVYTIDTLKILKQKYKNAYLYFLIGADQHAVFSTWKNPEEIIKLVQVVSVSRFGYTKDQAYPIYELPMSNIHISSTQIRTWIKNHTCIEAFVHPNVVKYIKEHHLYET